MRRLARALREHRWIVADAALLLGAALLLFVLYQTGIWEPNRPASSSYTVQGVDVSAHQGTVDFARLSAQRIRFAFVKATEGAGFRDSRFAQNWDNARKAELKTGAYHFFHFDVDAAAQAANFIRTVPVEADALPPVVDLEFYGRYRQNHPARAQVRRMLDTLLPALEARYGKPPILYCTGDTYGAYLKGAYARNPVWIRSVGLPPAKPANWTFWQYSDKGKLDGYSGSEPFIDFDVFCGSERELEAFAAGQAR